MPLEFVFLADAYFTEKGIRDKVDILYVTPKPGAFTKPVTTKMLSELLEEKNIKVIPDFYIEQMDDLDIPLVNEFLDMITAGGGKIYACKLAAEMFKLNMEDFNENVKAIITVGDLYAMSGGDGTQIIFT